MKHIFLLLITALLTPSFLSAQNAELGPEVAVMVIQIGRGRTKQLEEVVIGLHDKAAPVTVENFKNLARRRYYNGMRFHRIFPNTLVQTGDPNSKRGETLTSGTGGPGYTLPAEIGLPHVRGAVAMARLPDKINPSKASNGSQFYVCLTPMPNLNGEYTVFGRVLEGIEVLDAISQKPADSNDFPLEKIVIRSIKIVPRDSGSSQSGR